MGGAVGLQNIPKLSSIPTIWITLLIIYIFLRRLYTSPFGLALRASNDDEIAVKSCGLSPGKAKLVAFVIGSGLAGVAGVFYAHLQQLIVPDEASFLKSVDIVLAVVIGGMGSLFGSLLGALILLFVQLGLRFGPPIISQNSMIVFPIIVVVLMVISPQGIISLFQKKARKQTL